MDINRFLVPADVASSPHQNLINIHAEEDAWHWPWYLRDMHWLGFDKPLAFSDALRFIWGDASRHSRLLSYRCIALVAQATDVEKVAIVETIEMTGKVFLEHTARLCNAWHDAPAELLYFGQHHADCETGHHMGDEDVVEELESIVLTAQQQRACMAMVDELFVLYGNFVDDMLVFARQQACRPAAGFASIRALQDDGVAD
jgi:hypothetical protein